MIQQVQTQHPVLRYKVGMVQLLMSLHGLAVAVAVLDILAVAAELAVEMLLVQAVEDLHLQALL
jgi:ribosomal protein L3